MTGANLIKCWSTSAQVGYPDAAHLSTFPDRPLNTFAIVDQDWLRMESIIKYLAAPFLYLLQLCAEEIRADNFQCKEIRKFPLVGMKASYARVNFTPIPQA